MTQKGFASLISAGSRRLKDISALSDDGLQVSPLKYMDGTPYLKRSANLVVNSALMKEREGLPTDLAGEGLLLFLLCVGGFSLLAVCEGLLLFLLCTASLPSIGCPCTTAAPVRRLPLHDATRLLTRPFCSLLLRGAATRRFHPGHPRPRTARTSARAHE